MALFQYKAVAQDGRMESGTIELPDEKAVLSYLESLRVIPVEIQHKNESSLSLTDLGSWFSYKRQSMNLPLVDITRGLGMLLRAGMPVDQALKSLSLAIEDSQTKNLLTEMMNEVREGHSLSAVLERRQSLFGSLYVSMIRAGEVAGSLDNAVERLADHLEKSKAMKDRIVTAMLYPMILLLVTLASIVILMMVVVPRFKQLFIEMGGEIPFITQVFIGISDIMNSYGLPLFILLLLAAVVLSVLRRRETVAEKIDSYVLRLPWIGGLTEKIQMAQFAQTLCMLLSSGVAIQRSLEISRGVISNRVLNRDIQNEESLLSEGGTFSATIGKRFPALTQQMIRIGEEASELEQTLAHVADMAGKEVNQNINRVLKVIEPVIIVGLGAIVAGVISSIMVAILGMNDLVKI